MIGELGGMLASRKPTVLDVAKMASVSPSTVSRCLRGGNYVSDDVLRRVTEAVRLLQYEPNDIARSLRGDRTNSVGAIFPQIANPYFSRCVQQIELEATRQGSSVILLTHQEDPERQSRQLAVLRRARTDGVILTAAPGSNMDTLKQEVGDMPIVALDRPLWDEADVIMLRHREAARQATLHLLGHGLTNIVCVTANPSIYSFRERISGYKQAMKESGQKPNVISALDYNALEEAIREALRFRPGVEAVLSLSNMATVSALKAARSPSRKRTRQLALIGFDDADLATFVIPALTVMVQPTEEMAHESVELLFNRINRNGSHAVQRILSEGRLIRRESCGCVADGNPAQ